MSKIAEARKITCVKITTFTVFSSNSDHILQKQSKTVKHLTGLADLNHWFKLWFKSIDFFIKISDLNQYFWFF